MYGISKIPTFQPITTAFFRSPPPREPHDEILVHDLRARPGAYPLGREPVHLHRFLHLVPSVVADVRDEQLRTWVRTGGRGKPRPGCVNADLDELMLNRGPIHRHLAIEPEEPFSAHVIGPVKRGMIGTLHAVGVDSCVAGAGPAGFGVGAFRWRIVRNDSTKITSGWMVSTTPWFFSWL